MTTAPGTRLATPHVTADVGVARKDITPPLGIRSRNWGAASTDVSEGIHRPLTLTALAVAADAGPQLLIAVDGTWWRRAADEWSVRGRVLEALGLEPEQLQLNLSHTHAGPVLCATYAALEGGELIPAYLDSLAHAAIEAGREALNSRQPGRVEWGTGWSSLASNRELDVDGRPLVGYNPHRKADDTVMVGRVSSNDGKTIATIVNYACHPTTLAWDNHLTSPDFVGGMRALVESVTRAPCLFLQGASGELAPKEQYSGDVTLADRHGRSLGHAVLATLEGMRRPGQELEFTEALESGAPLGIWNEVDAHTNAVSRMVYDTVELSVDAPSLEELAERWLDLDEGTRAERLGRARNLREGYIDSNIVRHPVWAWRWGDAIIVGQPGEAYSRLQLTLRERFPNNPIIVMGLTNGPGFVYVPAEEAYERGDYQAWQTPLVVGSLDKLEDFATELIRGLLQD